MLNRGRARRTQTTIKFSVEICQQNVMQTSQCNTNQQLKCLMMAVMALTVWILKMV